MRLHVRGSFNNVLGQTMPAQDNSNLRACQMLQKYTVVQIPVLYWLSRLLDRRPAAEDYLLCHTGTLALRVDVRPGAYIIPLFAVIITIIINVI